MFFGWLDTGETFTPGSPSAVSKRRAAMLRVSVLPPGVLARPARRPQVVNAVGYGRRALVGLGRQSWWVARRVP
jgi:hypothetical protein